VHHLVSDGCNSISFVSLLVLLHILTYCPTAKLEPRLFAPSLLTQTCSASLPAGLCVAFPSLHTLSIRDVGVANGSLFISPNAWRALSSLSLHNFRARRCAVPSIATALACLPNLNDLTLGMRVSAGLAAQMTGLTSLCTGMDNSKHRVRNVLATAARNPGLQRLTMDGVGADPVAVAAPLLQHLLQSCTTLTSLDLCFNKIDQQGLDVLLQYGTCITTLAVASFNLSASRADRACSWESLEFEMGPVCGPFLKTLAYLPLRGIHTVSTPDFGEEFPASLEHLHVPLTEYKQAARRNLLRAAAVNVAACKAWQDCPTTTSVTLVASDGNDSCLDEVLCALAPLSAHIRALTITGRDGPGLTQTQQGQGRGTCRQLWQRHHQHLPQLLQAQLGFLASIGSLLSSSH
jgi:hypothetical protein